MSRVFSFFFFFHPASPSCWLLLPITRWKAPGACKTSLRILPPAFSSHFNRPCVPLPQEDPSRFSCPTSNSTVMDPHCFILNGWGAVPLRFLSVLNPYPHHSAGSVSLFQRWKGTLISSTPLPVVASSF